MKKKMILQFSLVTVAILLIFLTYYSSKDEDQIVKLDLDSDKIDTSNEKVAIKTEKMKNIIENANYTGTDNKGTVFEINAAIAKILNDEPNLSYMENVKAVIRLRDGRIVNIQSNYAVYNRLTNDTQFMEDIVITERGNEITSDNLDLHVSKNLITAYNNVKYNGKQGFLVADKVDIDILEKKTNIFMFDKKNKVQVKYKN